MQAGNVFGSSLRTDLAVALCWALAAALGAIAVLPYLGALFPAMFTKVKVPFAVFVAAQSLQSALLVFLLAFLGLRGRALTGLDSPLVRAWCGGGAFPADFGGRLAAAAFVGLATGTALFFADRVFSGLMPAPYSALPRIILWKRLLAAFYGGVTEECLTRLFLMSSLVWLCLKLAPSPSSAERAWPFWLGIALAALLFAVGHLPAAGKIWPLTPAVLSRTVVLNSAGGMVFGWLYWRWGFECAVVAHFCGDLVLHGFGSG